MSEEREEHIHHSSSSESSDEEFGDLAEKEKKRRKKWKKKVKKGKIPAETTPPWEMPDYVPATEDYESSDSDSDSDEDKKAEDAETGGDAEEEKKEEEKKEEEEKDAEADKDDEEKKEKSEHHKKKSDEEKEDKAEDDHDSKPAEHSEDLPEDIHDFEEAAEAVGKVSLDSTAELYRPTVRAAHDFSAENDSGILRESMKGTGTEEQAIIDVIGKRNNSQRRDIEKFFKTMYGKDLIADLQSEFSGNIEEMIMALFKSPAYYDAWSLHDAIAGAGTKDSTLIEILCTRSNSQILEIVQSYKESFECDLEQDIIGDTSGHYERLLVSCCQGNRAELTNDQLWEVKNDGPECVIDHDLAAEDAQKLFAAGEQKWGTDESAFLQVLALRHFYQLQATFEEYQKIAGKDILESIDDEMSGKLETGLKAIVCVARNRPEYFADKLYKSMSGLGTDDSTLIRIVVSRSEIDLQDIKEEFQTKYERSLAEMIASDTSGDYKNLLLAIVGE